MRIRQLRIRTQPDWSRPFDRPHRLTLLRNHGSIFNEKSKQIQAELWQSAKTPWIVAAEIMPRSATTQTRPIEKRGLHRSSLQCVQTAG
jgi:hypothetical protein